MGLKAENVFKPGADFNADSDFWAIVAATVELPYNGEITTERELTEGKIKENDGKRIRIIILQPVNL